MHGSRSFANRSAEFEALPRGEARERRYRDVVIEQPTDIVEHGIHPSAGDRDRGGGEGELLEQDCLEEVVHFAEVLVDVFLIHSGSGCDDHRTDHAE